MDPAAFLADLEAKPAALRRLADRLTDENPWAAVSRAERVVLIGMGSSRYAAGVAATRLRAAGVDAVVEYASLETATPGGPGTLALGISASGGTEETVNALARHRGKGGAVMALTNVAGSAVAEGADLVVDMAADEETGGVACRSFQHTLAMLLALEAHLIGDASFEAVPRWIRAAADATEDLLTRRDTWLDPARALLAEGPATFAIAPAERLSSAEQGALMLREGPRRTADACESGDWLHVDLYLTKPLDYRAILFAGSRFDRAIMEWMGERDGRALAVGGDIPGVAQTVRYPGDDVREIALLTEVLVPELVAATWWRAQAGPA
jgi:glucosamine 6-phosphate synthetase-like amidotransferase/phosphosugar isomerase protein